jgi:hypothetical protein
MATGQLNKGTQILVQKRRRAAARTRQRLARFGLFLLMIFGLPVATVPPAHALLSQINRVTTPYQFDFVDWESQALVSEVGQWYNPPANLPTDQAGQRTLIDQFVERETRRAELEEQLWVIYAAGPSFSQEALPLEEELTQLEAEQAEIIPAVEVLLAQQVETILREEGLTVAGQVVPPVTVRLIEPPTILVISPRDKIQNQYNFSLRPGLEHNIRAKIEAALDERGDIASYVTDLGGMASYPAMVVRNASISYLLDVIAHEWTHHYFFTHPTNLAWGYMEQPRLLTINETAASLAGEEIARKATLRFYPELAEGLAPSDAPRPPTRPSPFVLSMRHTRQVTDRLLALEKIETAERFMELERLKLAKRGYILRKLNQAYFAFHGSYALGESSVDPTGPQIRHLRAASSSLAAFLSRVAWLNSEEDYQAWLREAGQASRP